MSLDRRASLVLEIVLQHAPSARWDLRERLFLRKQTGESMDHVVMKLLCWLLLHREGLVIEAGVGQHYKPDLVALDAAGRPELWVDCGATAIRKIVALRRRNSNCHLVIVKAHPGAMERFRQQALTRLEDESNLTWLAFDPDFVSDLAGRLVKRHHIEATVPEDASALYLHIDGEALRTHVHRWPR